MKLLDLNGKLVSVNVCASEYPIRAKSKSILQGKVGEYLQKRFPRSVVLEEFTLPGNTRLFLDFFLPQMGVVIEVGSSIHEIFTPFYHGQRDEGKFGRQIERDRKKVQWSEDNGFKFIEISTEEEIEEKLKGL